MNRDVLTTSQAALELGITPIRVRQLIQQQRLKATKLVSAHKLRVNWRAKEGPGVAASTEPSRR